MKANDSKQVSFNSLLLLVALIVAMAGYYTLLMLMELINWYREYQRRQLNVIWQAWRAA